MKDLSFKRLRKQNRKRSFESFPTSRKWKGVDWALATFGELGEAANVIKKINRKEYVPIELLAHELADTVLYLDLLAEYYGIDLGAAVIEKFNIVSAKKKSRVRL